MTTNQRFGFFLLFLLLFVVLAVLMLAEGGSLPLWPVSALPVAPDELLWLNQ